MHRLPLFEFAPLASQTPPIPVTSSDVVGLIVIGGLALGFVVLAVLFVIRSRRKRIAELTEALEATSEDKELAAEAEAAALPEAAPAEAEKKTADDAEAAQRAHELKEAEKREAAKIAAEQQAAAQAEAAQREQEAQEAKKREAAKIAAEQQAAAEQQVAAAAQQEQHKKQRLFDGLSKTRTGFIGRLTGLFGGKRELDQGLLDELEQILITSDIGVKTVQHLLGLVGTKINQKEIDQPGKVRAALRTEIEKILALDSKPLAVGDNKPLVVMVVGVNGGGKTTTIGKLAQRFREQGQKVVLGAGDTFRAAATDQLEVWAQRAGAELVRGKEGQDPSSVLFEAVKRAQASEANVVIGDTAGRLHTKVNLMEELKKVYRVLGKAATGAPHEVLLVLDATTGQNAIAQAAQFNSAIPLTGIVLTKLDGTAKGGVIVGICQEFKIPVRYIGIGEQLDDLRSFDAHEFVTALFDEG